MPGTTVAVMQPYFFPYAGYYRLLACADIFVMLDCVQFPRRGRVHRCEVPGPGGATEWLTLPLARQPRDVLICDLAFAAGARGELDRRLARLDWIASARGPAAEMVRIFLHQPLGTVIDHLDAGIRLVAEILDLDARIVRSSQFGIDPHLRGQDRIIAIAAAAGAARYVNAPGGRRLYEKGDFERAGLELCFLAPYEGRFTRFLRDLMVEEPGQIAADIAATTRIEAA
jgi:hypothetical protein